jgi:hypothetical protein
MITGTSPPKTLNNSCLIIKPTLAAFFLLWLQKHFLIDIRLHFVKPMFSKVVLMHPFYHVVTGYIDAA